MKKQYTSGLKEEILHQWNFFRLLRLALGIFIVVESIITKDFTMTLLGSLLTAMPIFNIGCCGRSSCSPTTMQNMRNDKQISYEEVGSQ